MMALRPLIAVCGTTGVGKSKLAIELALALGQRKENRTHGYHGARIINADAMQVYKGMDVITNKVSLEEQNGVDHLLMDFKQPGEQYIVTQWVRDAMKVIDETHLRKQIPIVVGGTSYWIQHLIFSNRLVSFDQAPAEEELKRDPGPMSEPLARSFASLPPELLDLLNTLPEQGPSATTQPELAHSLHVLLSTLDPSTAQRWHWRDTRKVLRNLHIIRETGRRASDILAEQAQDTARPRYRTLCFWLYAKPEILKPRLDARVDEMVQQGLLNEIRALREIASANPTRSLSSPHSDSEDDSDTEAPITDYTLGIYQSIGYKEFHNYLSAPEHSEEEFKLAIENMKSATRKYAKRQIMWIRNKLLHVANAANGASRAEYGFDVTPTYLLDATELGKAWDTNVRTLAEQITEDFLNGKDLPDPCSLSETAREMLSTSDKRPSVDMRRKLVCPTCTVNEERPVMIAEGKEWDVHVRTRTHRRLFKKEHRRKDAANAKQTQPENKTEENTSEDDSIVDASVLFDA